MEQGKATSQPDLHYKVACCVTRLTHPPPLVLCGHQARDELSGGCSAWMSLVLPPPGAEEAQGWLEDEGGAAGVAQW